MEKTLHFDPMEVELGDMDVVEKITGVQFDKFLTDLPDTTAARKALYYLIVRQNDPDFTVAKLDKVKLREFVEVAEAFAAIEPDPTEGAGEA